MTKSRTNSFIMSCIALSASTLLAVSQALANTSPQRLTLQGRIVEPDGTPLESNPVHFTVEIRSPGVENCVLYKETHTLNMTSSGGVFSIPLGTGSRSGSAFENVSTLADTFRNRGATINSLSCASGTSYTPTGNQKRKIKLSFDPGSGMEELSDNLDVHSVPYALYADSLQGKVPGDFVQVNDTTASLTQANVESVFQTNTKVTELLALLNGTSTLYARTTGSNFSPTSAVNFGSQRITSLADPTAAQDAATKNYADSRIASHSVDLTGVGAGIGTGKVLSWNGTSSQWVTTDMLDTSKLPLSGGTLTGNLFAPTIYGSSAASGTLTLQSTNHATRGATLINPDGGRVGIGTASPAHLFHLYQTGAGSVVAMIEQNNGTNAELRVNGSGTTQYAGFRASNASKYWRMGLLGDNQFSIFNSTTGTNSLVIDSATGNLISFANVGIGSTNPGVGLHLFRETSDAMAIVESKDSASADIVAKASGTSTYASFQAVNATKLWRFGLLGDNDFRFYDNQSSRNTLTLQGGTNNVGIGTTNPNDLLHLKPHSGAAGLQLPLRLQNLNATSGAATGIGFKASADTTDAYYKGAIAFERTGTNAVGRMHILLNSSGAGNADLPDAKVTVLSTGSMGIGTQSPTEKLHVVGNLRVQGSTDCTLGNGSAGTSCSSDRRLKTNIRPISHALQKVLNMTGVEFEWNSNSASPGRRDIGVIAQEVEAQFPTVVTQDPATGYKRVDYGALVSPLIESTKQIYELCRAREKNSELAMERIRDLENENADLKSRLKKIEERLGLLD